MFLLKKLFYIEEWEEGNKKTYYNETNNDEIYVYITESLNLSTYQNFFDNCKFLILEKIINTTNFKFLGEFRFIKFLNEDKYNILTKKIINCVTTFEIFVKFLQKDKTDRFYLLKSEILLKY